MHGGTIFTLGEIIHNPQAVERLRNKGVVPVHSLDEIPQGSTLVIRAHGVEPGLLAEAKRRGITLLDATCPFVLKSQRYVKRLSDESYQVIIIGDREHPEVRSISAHARREPIIINSVSEAARLDGIDKAGVVIQTTFAREHANRIIGTLESRIPNLRVYDTICQATVLRRESTLELARSVNLMLIIGGKRSSNTKRLFQMCLDAGIEARFIETAAEIDEGWFAEHHRVGLSTGTSTPDWIIDEVLERLDAISGDPPVDGAPRQ
jgi:4-hydroxy-3-methylbut-2-enyl diphosphate reductase